MCRPLVRSAPLTDDVRRDRYLNPHYHYYMREVRVVAYTQFLESYKSVTLDAMAEAFGVSVPFLDRCVVRGCCYALLYFSPTPSPRTPFRFVCQGASVLPRRSGETSIAYQAFHWFHRVPATTI